MSAPNITEFADKMNEIMPLLMKEFARRQVNELYKGKLTLPQFLVLDYLSRAGETKMSVLAKNMSVTTAAMTGSVDRLVRDGYARRRQDPSDRRIVNITLSSSGIAVVKRVNHDRRMMMVEVFGKLSDTERQQYSAIMIHIRDILLEKRQG